MTMHTAQIQGNARRLGYLVAVAAPLVALVLVFGEITIPTTLAVMAFGTLVPATWLSAVSWGIDADKIVVKQWFLTRQIPLDSITAAEIIPAGPNHIFYNTDGVSTAMMCGTDHMVKLVSGAVAKKETRFSIADVDTFISAAAAHGLKVTPLGTQ